MPVQEIHSGDFGTVLNIQLLDGTSPVDVSNASFVNIIFRKPSYPPTTYTRQATLVGDGTAGQVQYIPVSGEIDMLGTWQIQGYIVNASGAWHSDVAVFKVVPNL